MPWLHLVAYLVFIAAGVALTFAVAYGLDAYHSWRYHFRHIRELRERPTVPLPMARLSLIRVSEERVWLAMAYDREGRELATNTGAHPMDAVRNVITEREEHDHASTKSHR